MGRSNGVALSAVVALALVASACGSDDEAGGGGDDAGAGGSSTLTLGLLTSTSGGASSEYAVTEDGVNARLQAYEAEGGECADEFEFEVVTADDASSPQGALAAAQRLVQLEDVDALLEVSSTFFGAAPFLTTQGSDIPVFGAGFDGAQEWSDTDDNLFLSARLPDYDAAFTTGGDYFALQGATKIAGVAYAVPSAQQAIEVLVQSAEAAGLERVYVNDSVPIGSTDVGSIVLQIMEAGADALQTAMLPSTAFAILDRLREAGYELDTVVLPTGYSSDLLTSPAAASAEGVSFQLTVAPVELESEATTRFASAMQEYAGVDGGIPGFALTTAWVTTDLFLYGLEQNGCDASSDSLISTLQQADDWDAGGLYPGPVPQTTTEYDENCLFYVKVENGAFVPVEEASPLCGGPVD